jgi:predicted transposase YdaD
MIEIARKMHQQGLQRHLIRQFTGLSEEEIQQALQQEEP